MEEKSKKGGLIITIIIVGLVVLAGIYFLFGGKNKLVSPVPEEPSFKVIYYTPTPGIVTPSSTPSATPKLKATPAKTISVTVAPTKTGSPSATITP